MTFALSKQCSYWKLLTDRGMQDNSLNIARLFWMELLSFDGRLLLRVTTLNKWYLVLLVILPNFLVRNLTNNTCIHCSFCETSKVSWVCRIKKKKKSLDFTSSCIRMYTDSVTLVYLFVLLSELLPYLGISNIVQDHLITVNKLRTKKTFLQINHGVLQEGSIVL